MHLYHKDDKLNSFNFTN